MKHPDDNNGFPDRMTGDLGASFEKIKAFILPIYRGRRYSERDGKLWFMGKGFNSLSEIYDEIDRFLDEEPD